MKITEKTYGLWSSFLSPSSLAGALKLSEVAWSGDGETLVWLEGRDGRGVLVASRQGNSPRDLHDELSVRGGVGYGGGEFSVHGDEVFFAEAKGGLYRVSLDKGMANSLVPTFGRVASPRVSPDGTWVAYIHTVHDVDVVAAVDTRGKKWPVKLVEGADFYMQPAWHPGGSRLAWIAWDHPQMPWNGTRLETALAEVTEDGIKLGPIQCWAGDQNTAIFQPEFSPDGKYLAYASDESGWWHLYVRELESGDVTQLTEGEVEYAGPAWIQGLRTFAWTPDSKSLVAVQNLRGVMSIVTVDLSGELRQWKGLERYESFAQPAISSKGHLAAMASSSNMPSRIISCEDSGKVHIHRHSSSERLAEEDLAPMMPVSWSLDEEVHGIAEVFGNYYPPTNPSFRSKGRPPALIMIHGGPTTQRTAGFEARNQFFATRGFGVLDVNYRGSTGYGRSYMDALFGQWGVADVEDAVSAAQYLIDNDLADPDKIVIMGGSAGGYTVLQALVNHPGVFAAGICLYGISNLFALQMGTHKFEAYYNDSLLGPLPEASDIYRERSPIYHAQKIKDPVAVYHGALDKVVPLDQAEAIVSSLKARRVPHLYHVYEDEGHGWRRAKNIEHFHCSVLDFLKEHVVFK